MKIQKNVIEKQKGSPALCPCLIACLSLCPLLLADTARTGSGIMTTSPFTQARSRHAGHVERDETHAHVLTTT